MNAARRLISFYRRHGLRSTCERCYESIRRSSHFGRMVLFSCPLPWEPGRSSVLISLECVTDAELSSEVRDRLVDVWDPEGRDRQLAARFANGCHLWLARVDGRIAGYGWTLAGGTIEPHFFPLKPDEVHLFDFFVFPEFRGRGINVALVEEILVRLGRQPLKRAHIECAAWNHAQIRSLGKTSFHRCAEATKVKFAGFSKVIWHRGARPE